MYFLYYNMLNQTASVNDAPSFFDMITFDALRDAKKELIIFFMALGLYVSMATYNNYLDRMEIEEEMQKKDWFN